MILKMMEFSFPLDSEVDGGFFCAASLDFEDRALFCAEILIY